MKEIILSLGYVALVDDDDYESLSKFNWHVKLHGSKRYAVRNNKRGSYPRNIKMHRQIMSVDSDITIDHINGDGLDNRKSNLRLASQACNTQNKRVTKNKHGYKGVSFIGYCQNKGKRWPRKKPWTANITAFGKNYRLGYYETPEEAADAYDAAAKEYHGQFAATNKELGLR